MCVPADGIDGNCDSFMYCILCVPLNLIVVFFLLFVFLSYSQEMSSHRRFVRVSRICTRTVENMPIAYFGLTTNKSNATN